MIQFALRWRTETEVVSGAGESTCGNTRCHRHHHDHNHKTPVKPKKKKQKQERPLTTLELPFSYIEHGESKYALVKVVLCTRCVKKLMWKRRKEKEHGVDGGDDDDLMSQGSGVSEDGKSGEEEEEKEEKERGEESRVMGKQMGKEKERTGMRDEQDPRRMHHATTKIKARTRSREQTRRCERDHYVQQNEHSMRAAAPRSKERTRQRNNSRSRSPPRHHFITHMQSQSYPSSSSKNHRHVFDRRNVE